MSSIAKVLDVFFNGRPADEQPAPSGVTLAEIVRRKSCVVRVGKKYYRIESTEVTLTAKEKGK